MTQEFFDAVRPMFRRQRLSASQVTGMEAILEGCDGLPRAHKAYILATAYHETGQRMVPVREGFAKTDLGARRAVKGLFDKGIIRENYALPHPKTGKCYYGRGLVQITWWANYASLGNHIDVDLEHHPDLALDLPIAVDCLVQGMIFGFYRHGYDLDMLPEVPTLEDFTLARNIINGDRVRNGKMIAEYAVVFYNALRVPKFDQAEPEDHSLWCKLLDLIGLGDHSDTGV